MKGIETAIDIDATPEQVWDVLTDFSAYPEWNPRMVITGRPTLGARLLVAPGPEAGRMPSFRPRVTRVDPPREFRWQGHLWMPGIFDGDHRFVIENSGDGRSRLVQSEAFAGILARPILAFVRGETEAGFEAMNAALKERVESLAGTESTTGPVSTPV